MFDAHSLRQQFPALNRARDGRLPIFPSGVRLELVPNDCPEIQDRPEDDLGPFRKAFEEK